MSEPADWLRQISENIRVDLAIPPGAIVMRSGIDQVISVSEVTHIHAATRYGAASGGGRTREGTRQAQ